LLSALPAMEMQINTWLQLLRASCQVCAVRGTPCDFSPCLNFTFQPINSMTQSLAAAKVVKKFPAFCGTRCLIIVVTWVLQCRASSANESTPCPHYFFKKYFSSIFLSTSLSSKCPASCMFSD